ncbi:hypothetical protein HY772_03950, partial [Candidatus Woesearchaeota archaeon]|nr:hypothetical protein [Candidatus Woesearchaeota archaeon]
MKKEGRCMKKEKMYVLALTLYVVGTGALLAVYTALLALSVAAQSSAASNQLSGMITLEDISDFWFVPAIAVGMMVIYLLYENRQRLVAIASRKNALSLIETVLSEGEAELLSKAPLAKRLVEKQRKREASVRRVEERTSSELDIGKRILVAFKRLLPSKSSPDTVGGQLAVGTALKRSGVAFDLERLIKENKDDRGLISAVVASLRGDFDTIKDKQSKIKSRNKKLAKLEQALEELARLQGTISSERANLEELRRLHAGLDEITTDESTTFEALLKEFSEVEQEFAYVSQVCSVVATISAQMRAELAAVESGDTSFEARKAEIEKMQQNAIRLQQLLTEKRDRLSRLLSVIVRMRDEIVKASIDDLARLQQARREEAAIHLHRVAELTAKIAKKEGEKKEIEKRRKALDQRRDELEAKTAQRQQRIKQLTVDLEAEKKRSETIEAALTRAEQVHKEALAEKEKIISNFTEGKRVAEASRDELARERDAAKEQHRWALARIAELEEQERSLRESIGQGTAAIAAAREGLSSKERKFEEEKSALSASEQERRQAELAAQRSYFEETISKIQESLDESRSAMET